MTDYINITQVITMFITVLWTTIFSLSIKPGIRGFRNLGILGKNSVFSQKSLNGKALGSNSGIKELCCKMLRKKEL